MRWRVLYWSSIIFSISVLATFALFPTWGDVSVFAPFLILLFALFFLKITIGAGLKNMMMFSVMFLSFMTVAGPPACRYISPESYWFWRGGYNPDYVEISSYESDGGSINEIWKVSKTDSRLSLSLEVNLYKTLYKMNIWCKYKNAPHVNLEVQLNGPVELRWGSGNESWSAEIERSRLILPGGRYHLEFIDLFQEQGFVEIIGDDSRTVRISAPTALAYLDFAKCRINPTPPPNSLIPE